MIFTYFTLLINYLRNTFEVNIHLFIVVFKIVVLWSGLVATILDIGLQIDVDFDWIMVTNKKYHKLTVVSTSVLTEML